MQDIAAVGAGAALVLDTLMAFHRADFGTVQRVSTGTRKLAIVAQRNFSQEFLKLFREVDVFDESACGRAFRNGTALEFADVALQPSFRPYLALARREGFRAVQSTPMVRAGGEVLGMLSTHFRERHSSSDTDRAFARSCAGALVDLIHRVEQV